MPLFEHVNLKDIDPTIKKLTQRVYPLYINKVDIYEGVYDDVYKTGAKAGQENPKVGKGWMSVNLSYTIVDDEEFAGRRVRSKHFMDEASDAGQEFFAAFVKRIADATSYEILDGESPVDFLKRIQTEAPPVTFRALVNVKDETDGNGNTFPSATVNPFQIMAHE